jgi:ABC-type transport system involved in cytochrome c biogenesis permease subunit
MSTKAEIGYAPLPLSPESSSAFSQLLPAIAGIVGATLLVLFRFQGSTLDMLREGSLTNLALISYLGATLFYGMFIIGRDPLMRKLGLWTMTLGFAFNFAAWGVRWIEYVEFTKAQGDMMKLWPAMSFAEKVNHTFPLSNLYDITLGLTTWLGITSVVLGARKKYEFIGIVTMPVIALFLILAVFLGNNINQPIQPILRSYWRPIHVGVAALSYGICAVSFAISILYLLKDNVRPERIALSIAGFGITIYLLVAGLFGNFSLLTGRFGMNVEMGGQTVRFSGARGDFLTAEFPLVGNLLQLVVICFGVAIALYIKDAFFGEDDKLRKAANGLFYGGVLFQILAVGLLAYNMRVVTNLPNYIPETQLMKIADGGMIHDHTGDHNHEETPTAAEVRSRLSERASVMKVRFGSNPIVSAGFFTVIFGGFFFLLLKLKGQQLLSNIGTLDILDDLNYKLVSICFPGFTLMLILGAVWANESWGTYWSWDPKETWGLITWLAYAGFLHTRFSHGWKGRRSAYFAIAGFIFMLFTYLGVSYLLPGLHSYA